MRTKWDQLVMWVRRQRVLGGFLAFVAFTPSAGAETLKAALARTYLSNPQLNAQRANTRGVDENLPISRGTFLPTANAVGSFGALQQDLLPPGTFGPDGNRKANNNRTLSPPAYGQLVVSMNIFNGFRGINGINSAEAQIHQSREILRNMELSVLGSAATAYVNVMRDVAIVMLRENYVKILVNQVEITKERLAGGEVTQTDVYQAETYLAQAKQDQAIAHVNLENSLSVYRQIIGTTPDKLAPAPAIDALLPKDLGEALQIADADHPLAVAARYNVEVSELGVKIVEGQLLPTVNLNGLVSQQYNYFGVEKQRFFQASGTVQVNVPIYEGGISYAQVRQAKEKAGEAKLLYDQQINQIHQSIEATWAAWKESIKFLAAAKEHVRKAEFALAGVREEAKYGARTTWDILNAQLQLVNARIGLVTGQRERIITTYNLLGVIGRLSSATLDLDVPTYEPTDHYDRVKRQWIGVNPW
jgi:outer membrane protein